MYQKWTIFIAWVTGYEQELTIAFVAAIICWVVLDLVKNGSIAGVRKLNNKLSEYSVARLQNRIRQLEAYRDIVNSYTTSDRALYLATLQLMVGVLVLVCVGAVVVMLDFLFPSPSGPPIFIFAALVIFLIAIVLGAYGVQLAGLNTRSKVSARVATLDSEINDLKAKLELRTRKM